MKINLAIVRKKTKLRTGGTIQMKVKRIAVLLALICICTILAGCSAKSVTVPKNELQRKAIDAINAEISFPYSSIQLVSDSYDDQIKAYEMNYRIESYSTHNITVDYIMVRARSFYDRSAWGNIKLSWQDRTFVPNLSGIKTHLYAESPLGGSIAIDLLSVDDKSHTITLNIDADNLVVKEEHNIARRVYTLNRKQQSLVCTYSYSSDNVLIDLGAWDGSNNQLFITPADAFETHDEKGTRYVFAVGNSSIFGVNAVIDLN